MFSYFPAHKEPKAFPLLIYKIGRASSDTCAAQVAFVPDDSGLIIFHYDSFLRAHESACPASGASIGINDGFEYAHYSEVVLLRLGTGVRASCYSEFYLNRHIFAKKFLIQYSCQAVSVYNAVIAFKIPRA